MTESTDRPSDSPASREVMARASQDGIAVRKVATMHGSEAVAIYFTIRSIREDRCTVRIADALPEPLRENEVEFHPKYDPVNWTRTEGTVVYAATVPPDANRTTVYGVVVEDPDQLQLFSATPAVEVTDSQPAGADGLDSGFSFQPPEEVAEPSPDQAGPDSSGDDLGSVLDTGSSSAAADADESAEDEGADSELESKGPYFSGPDVDVDDGDDFGLDGERPRDRSRDSVLDELVSEVRRRDLTKADRRALQKALGLEGAGTVDRRLETIREEVETLRDEVAAADRQAADVDRIESRIDALSDAIDDRYASLSAEIEELSDRVERGAQWRSQFQEFVRSDSEAEQ